MIFAIIMILVIVWAIPSWLNIQAWNNGICKKCGRIWKKRSADPTNGTLCHCETCGNVLWVKSSKYKEHADEIDIK